VTLRITCIGHAGLHIETRYGDILCDPWVNPAYFGSWCVFPDNSGLDWDRLGQARYLYVSHLHKDHFDQGLLRDHVSKDITVLLPDYPVPDLREHLEELGFANFRLLPDCETVEIDGLRLMIQALRSPTDGPLGDSALAVSDGTATILDMNDARPGDLDPLLAFGPFDVHFLQYSGAIWWPWTYELPDAAKRAFGAAKRANGLDRAVRYVRAIGARYVVPHAGPPCFLDEELFSLNDSARDPSSTFPDQQVFLDYLAGQGIDGGQMMVPGAVMDIGDGRCEVRLPGSDGEALRPFTDKQRYLEEYAARMRPRIEAEKRTWPVPGLDLLAELKAWFEPLLELADHIKAGVGGPVLLRIRGSAAGAGGNGAGPGTAAEDEERIVIDFPAGEVRAHSGEPCRYEFTFERPLIERLVSDHQVDWVNSLFLSLRFRARRVGQYNEYIYTFFKCLAPDRLMYAEGWYADQKHDEGDIRIGDWMVQRRCPHLRGDLSRFGSLDGTTLTCAMHGWQFDLPTGHCLTSDAPGHELRARPVSEEDGAGRPGEAGEPWGGRKVNVSGRG
jgi:UDP-MurNAc hydroxylase